MPNALKYFFGIFLCVPLLIGIGFRIERNISFNINCGGHMEMAASANSIELAREKMRLVVKYAEEKKLTSGYTSNFWNTPDEDVGFWYRNMAASLLELEGIKPGASELEKSNVLMKLRETLVDHAKGGGVSITVPEGISIFPHNSLVFWGLVFSSILAVVGGLLIFYTANNHY